ncbi:MAG: hypothetical protein R3200_17550, partial [Xanthomonadales bacterium]|nr:hypothetical protein [Xanthomonadales bacterium]
VLNALSPDHAETVRQRITELVAERDRLFEHLAHLRFVRACYPSDANFLLLRVANANELLDAAAGEGFVLRDMQALEGLENCVRISIGSDLEMGKFYRFLDWFDRKS